MCLLCLSDPITHVYPPDLFPVDTGSDLIFRPSFPTPCDDNVSTKCGLLDCLRRHPALYNGYALLQPEDEIEEAVESSEVANAIKKKELEEAQKKETQKKRPKATRRTESRKNK